MLGRPLSLFILVAVCSSVVAVTIIALVARSIEIVVADQLTTEVGHANSFLATQIQDDLDQELFERFRDLDIASKLFAPITKANTGRLGDWFSRELRAEPGYVWLGLIDLDGKIMLQAGDTSVFSAIDDWPCIKTVLNRRPAGADPALSYAACDYKGQNSASLVALGAPVLDDDGRVAGAILGTVSQTWVQSIASSLVTEGQKSRRIQILVVSESGDLVLAVPSVQTSRGVAALPHNTPWTGNYAVDVHWPGSAEGTKTIIGRAEDTGKRRLSSLHWRVYVSQQADDAFASLAGMHEHVVIITVILALHAIALAWYMARAISAPLARLAGAAQALNRGLAGSSIPLISTFTEVEVLSRSLISLVSDLQAKKDAQSKLAGSLERLVIERTDELAQRNKSLEAANRAAADATTAKTRFLAAASHDLRQPLHALALFARALEKRVTGAEATGLVEQMRYSIAQLTRMFDALLHISRLDAGAITAELTQVRAGQIMAGLSKGFAAEAEHRGLTFRCRDCDWLIRTDVTLLETILRNLIANAMKFTSRGGILLAARRRGSKVSIEVYDTGIGIDSDGKDSIFQEFERATNDAHGRNDGLGLGLSIVKRYAGLIGAEIEWRSRPGRGSSFRVIVPAGTDPAGEMRACKTSGNVTFRSQRILLLDDNAIGLDALAHNLGDQGAMVSSFQTSEAASAALGRGLAVDFMIVDYELGKDSNGLQFLRDCRSSGIGLPPSVIITGRTDPKTLARLDESGFPWLLKPADPDAIAAALMGARLSVPPRHRLN